MNNVNLDLVDFLTKTNNIKGCSFATIKGYTNTANEVGNHLINLGASLSNAKVKDLETMRNTNANDLFENFTFENSTMPFDIFEKAFNELQDSFVKVGDKLINGTTKERSNRSQAQIDAYTLINNQLKVHNEKQRLYIYALRLKKEILVKGEYKSTNKQRKTICKDYIKKALDFKTSKFTMFIVEKADLLNLAKTSFKGENLEINL